MALSIILTAFSAMNTLSAMNTQGHIYWAAISPAIVTIGLYCYCLWPIARKREAFVVKHTIVILWVVGPISVLLLSLVFGVAVETYAVLRSSVYAMLWTLYFLFSKRVACTYGTKAVDSYVEVALKMAQAQKEQKAKDQFFQVIQEKGLPGYALENCTALEIIDGKEKIIKSNPIKNAYKIIYEDGQFRQIGYEN